MPHPPRPPGPRHARFSRAGAVLILPGWGPTVARRRMVAVIRIREREVSPTVVERWGRTDSTEVCRRAGVDGRRPVGYSMSVDRRYAAAARLVAPDRRRSSRPG